MNAGADDAVGEGMCLLASLFVFPLTVCLSLFLSFPRPLILSFIALSPVRLVTPL